MPRRRPDAQFAPRCRQRVSENQGTLFGQPERRLVAAQSVVEGDDASRKLTAGIDRLQPCLEDVLAKEHPRAEGPGTIAANKHIYIPNVIRLETCDRGRR